MTKRPQLTKSPKRINVERAYAQLPAETQERILAFVYALMLGRRDRPHQLGEVRKVVSQGIQ